MVVSPDERLVVFGSQESGRLEALDIVMGSSTVHRVEKLTSFLSLAVLPGNRFAMAGGQPGILCKVDLITGVVTDWVPASLLGIHAMTLSPGATRLATGDAQGRVKLWDVETLREVAVLGTHPGIVTGLQFQPDGRTLLSVDNSELRIWQMQ